DKRGHDPGTAVTEMPPQVDPALGLDEVDPGAAEGVVDLVVEVDTIGHEHDPRVVLPELLQDRVGEHHHREALPAPLGMPDNTALPRPVRSDPPDPLHRPLHAEVLLVPGDLPLASLEEREVPHELEEPLGAAESIEQPVLLGHLPAEGEGVEVGLDLRAMRGPEPRPLELAPQFVDLASGARPPEPRQLFLRELALTPP